MKHIKLQRVLALLVAVAAVLTLSPVPGRASQYKDVSDKQVALAADVLSALGVVNGTAPGEFSPEGHLTRAQLCKMAIEMMGLGEEAKAQAFRTIFSDVKGSHWASGYVNLAAVTEVEGSRLMLGLGNGQFGPDQEVTYQEAATMVLRILGYSAEANRVWPFSAIETAGQLGLDKDLGISAPSAPITRGQTAVLFYNLLATPAKGDTDPYANRLGKLEKDVIVLATNASINGRSGWVLLARNGEILSYPAAAPLDDSQLGLRGWAMLDQDGQFISLVPDDSASITAVVKSKQGDYLYLEGQERFTMPADTPVYTGSTHDAAVSTYKEYKVDLRVGDTVTLYQDDKGRVVGLYRGESSVESGFVVVKGKVTTDTFRPILGDGRYYTIRKNGADISLSQIKEYDVVTYDPINKALNVCDVHLSCYYENAEPTPNYPSEIVAAGGNKFQVMADAMGDFAGLKLGDQITLLFTASGKVAGVMPKQTGGVGSQAVGVLLDGRFHLLGCNLVLSAENAKGGAFDMKPSNWNCFYTASSNKRGELSLTAAGDTELVNVPFNINRMMVDDEKVGSGVRVYERLNSGALVLRNLAELPSSPTVYQYHMTGNYVDSIILAPYSGEGENYGRIDVINGFVLTQSETNTGPNGSGFAVWVFKPTQQVRFTGKDGSSTTYNVDGSLYYSGYGTISFKADGSIADITYLKRQENIRSSSSFFVRDGVTYVNTAVGALEVAEDVLCINRAALNIEPLTPPMWVYSAFAQLPSDIPSEWYQDAPEIVRFDSLGECRGFSDTVTVYYDEVAKIVRAVEAE